MDVPNALKEYVDTWANTQSLTPIDIDCTTTVMLKILDGKCKMKPESKVVMELLYDAIKDRTGQLFEQEDFHQLIANARHATSSELKNHIYEKRLLAETILSRPVMKKFKAMIREQGLFESPAMTELVFEED